MISALCSVINVVLFHCCEATVSVFHTNILFIDLHIHTDTCIMWNTLIYNTIIILNLCH